MIQLSVISVTSAYIGYISCHLGWIGCLWQLVEILGFCVFEVCCIAGLRPFQTVLLAAEIPPVALEDPVGIDQLPIWDDVHFLSRVGPVLHHGNSSGRSHSTNGRTKFQVKLLFLLGSRWWYSKRAGLRMGQMCHHPFQRLLEVRTPHSEGAVPADKVLCRSHAKNCFREAMLAGGIAVNWGSQAKAQFMHISVAHHL
jgi:hypothetical protein